MKLMVIPVGRSLVFSGSQAKNISYSTSGSLVFPDHRQKIFRTLPITGKKYFVLYLRWLGEEFFSSDIMWWLGDWTRLILHQLPLPRKSLKRGKDILVSTSWWEVVNHIPPGTWPKASDEADGEPNP
jgi:hypothetical protein